MCMQDLAIARRTYIKTTVVTAGTQYIMPKDNQRIGVRTGAEAQAQIGNFYSVQIDVGDTLGPLTLFQYSVFGGSVELAVAGRPDWTIDYRSDPALCVNGVIVKAQDSNVICIETLLEPDLAKAVASEIAHAIPRK